MKRKPTKVDEAIAKISMEASELALEAVELSKAAMHAQRIGYLNARPSKAGEISLLQIVENYNKVSFKSLAIGESISGLLALLTENLQTGEPDASKKLN